ncbi:MFS transporter [Deinococcus altitudinis]|uniref:MFS transporter n=1 Tax=Deinococcus altitudinis TaxID=468914 RepID=UPI0038926E17
MIRRVHYAWVILAVCFFGILAAQGTRLSFGAFVTPWQREFHLDRSTVSLISLVSFVVYGLTQPLVGRLVDRLGVRLVMAVSVLIVGLSLIGAAFVHSPLGLTLMYGGLASLGFGGASGVAASVAVTQWFREKRGLAFGIIEAGFGAGQFVLVPASLFLIDAHGWRVTLAALGAFAAVVAFPVLLVFLRNRPDDVLLRPYGEDRAGAGATAAGTGEQAVSPPEASGQPDVTEQPADRINLWTSRAFWSLILPFFICGVSTTGMIDTHLVPFAHDHGYSTAVTGAAVSLLAAFNVFGTLASGPLADRFDNRKILGTLYALRAVTLVVLVFAPHGSVWLVVFGVAFGLVDFAVLAPTQVLASRLFEGHSVGLVFGLLSLSHQLGSALGAYLPGLLYDATGSYNVAFLGAAGGLVLGSMLSFSVPHRPPLRKLALT